VEIVKTKQMQTTCTCTKSSNGAL